MGVSLSRYPKSSNHGDDWGTNILGHRHMVRDFPSYKALSIEFFFHGFSHGCSDDFCHGLLLRHLPEGWAHGRRAQQGHWRWRCGTQGRSQGAAGGWRRGWAGLAEIWWLFSFFDDFSLGLDWIELMTGMFWWFFATWKSWGVFSMETADDVGQYFSGQSSPSYRFFYWEKWRSSESWGRSWGARQDFVWEVRLGQAGA